MKPVDFKRKEAKLYSPVENPSLVDVPAWPFVVVEGKGDPNYNLDFQNAIEILYSLSYDIRMSPRRGEEPEGYFPYVVPPLEGLWWIGKGNFSFNQRENWLWRMMIRQPDFVDERVFMQSFQRVTEKKMAMMSSAAPRFEIFHEGLCVQILHVGSYETEPVSVDRLTAFCESHDLIDQVGFGAKHHEIYLSDPRKVDPSRRKTILRHPVKPR